MRIRLLWISVLLVGCTVTAGHPGGLDAVITTERQFSDHAGRVGWVQAFLDYAAADGEMIQGGLRNAHALLAEQPRDRELELRWWPLYAGASQSADLGFTTGAYSVSADGRPAGHYFTVWRLQPDGSWRWIFDGGVGPMPALAAEDAAVERLPPVAVPGMTPARADDSVGALEAVGDSGALLVEYLADDARVYRRGEPWLPGSAVKHQAQVAIAGGSHVVRRTVVSSARDLAFAVGDASWRDDAGVRQGVFARVWQRRPEGWRIVYDQVVPVK